MYACSIMYYHIELQQQQQYLTVGTVRMLIEQVSKCAIIVRFSYPFLYTAWMGKMQYSAKCYLIARMYEHTTCKSYFYFFQIQVSSDGYEGLPLRLVVNTHLQALATKYLPFQRSPDCCPATNRFQSAMEW